MGFDWSEPGPVFEKVREELAELAAESEPEGRGRELGDLLFSVVNLSRHLAVEPETALRAAIHRFEERFRAMERIGSLDGLTLEELDALWEAVKAHPTGEFG